MYCHFTLIGQHHALHAINNEEEFVTCKNCKMTTLASISQTKLVSQMMIKADQTKLENFTCFNGFLAFSEIMFNE